MKRILCKTLWLLFLFTSLNSFSQTPSVRDIDDDNDGILDMVENNGYEPFGDDDADGIKNYLDPTPGCPTPPGLNVYGKPYPPLTWTDCNNDGINDFFDWDRDGIINELDLDSDNDGILDIQEARDSKATDANHDGMADGVDADRDGLMSTADANDNNASVTASIGLIPQDLDRDGHPNYLDLDSDADGVVDNREALQLDAFAAGYTGLTMGMNDDDKDGVRTINYTNNNNDADNFDGFGAKGIILLDNDGDGYPNPYDIDSDNDGITDNVEAQPTCSYVEPNFDDVDGDGLCDAYDADNNGCVVKAAGITPYDKDFDGTPDMRDLDTDNDGAPDLNEGSGIYTNFITSYADTDGDGLIDFFDAVDLKTTTFICNNVCHNEMGTGGTRNGPVPGGSNASLPQMMIGDCPFADRDWRNVAILPLSMISFSGTSSGNTVQLRWKVDNESNMSHYEVEKSVNGREYNLLKEVSARNTSTLTTYGLQDNISGGNTLIYYRLREIDRSGTFKLSRVITVKIKDGNQGLIVYPSPAQSLVNIKFRVQHNADALITLSDNLGRIAAIQKRKVIAGDNLLQLNVSGVPTGAYYIKVSVDEQVLISNLLIGK